MESKIKKSSNYAEIIKRNSIEISRGWRDESMLVRAITAIFISSCPEHKASLMAQNFLEWVNAKGNNVVPRAFNAIKELVSADLYVFVPKEFISDGRDTSNMIPPNMAEWEKKQMVNYSPLKDTQFWAI